MSSQIFWDPKMSVAINTVVSSMTMWIRAKWPMVRLVGLGLCSRRKLWTWKRRRMVLAEIPMPTLEKKAFLMPVKLKSLLFSFIFMGENKHVVNTWGETQEKHFITNMTNVNNLNQHYCHHLNRWVDPNAFSSTLQCIRLLYPHRLPCQMPSPIFP